MERFISFHLVLTFIHSAESVAPDESLPMKQTVVFLNLDCDFNATIILAVLRRSV